MGEFVTQLDDCWYAGVVDEHIQPLTAQSLLDSLLGITAMRDGATAGRVMIRF